MNIGHGREEEEEKQNSLALYRQFQWNLKLPLAKIGLSNIAAQALIACYVLESGSPCSHSSFTVLMNPQICLLPSGTLQFVSSCSFLCALLIPQLSYASHLSLAFSSPCFLFSCLSLAQNTDSFHNPRSTTLLRINFCKEWGIIDAKQVQKGTAELAGK